MKRITPTTRVLLFSLKSKYKYFSRNRRLDKDGSFFYSDGRLAKELGISGKTVERAKKHLKKINEINFAPGKYKGLATKYWLKEVRERVTECRPMGNTYSMREVVEKIDWSKVT